MVTGSTKKTEARDEPDPEVTERKRLKTLAFSNNLLSDAPSQASAHLNPSKTVVKHHGKDILKKSQRKNRFLFGFPGLLAPIGGGKIGELKDLGTKNPVLYLDFPQGRMKLFGTIVYPKNRYLTLQFSRGGKSVMCEDYFDTMIVFSDAWWVGRKEENPEEARLEFPKEMNEGQVDYDFKGGAGGASVDKQGISKSSIKPRDQSPKIMFEDDLSDSVDNLKDTAEVTPIRHSKRTAGKKYNFAEASSGDDAVESSPDVPDSGRGNTSDVQEVVVMDKEAAIEKTPIQKKNKKCTSVSSSGKPSQSVSHTTSMEVPSTNCGSLVQATISTLFKKVESKKASRTPKKSASPKVSSKKLQLGVSKMKINQLQAEGSNQKAKKIKGKDTGENKRAKKRECEVEDDDGIEEFSSDSEHAEESDEDWAA